MSKKIKTTIPTVSTEPAEAAAPETTVNHPAPEDIKQWKEIFEEVSKDPNFKVIAHEPVEVKIVVEDLKQEALEQGLKALDIGMNEFRAYPEKMKILLEMEAKRERISKAFGGGGLYAVSKPASRCHIGSVIPGLEAMSEPETLCSTGSFDPSTVSPLAETTPSATEAVSSSTPLDTETTTPYIVGE
jgi:hypothetical protein